MTKPLAISPSELQQLPLFAHLPSLHLQMVCGLMRRESFSTNGILMAVDETPPRVYVLQSGTVKVCIARSSDTEAADNEAEAEGRHVMDGQVAGEGSEGAEVEGAESLSRTVVLNLCGPGDILGEMSALDGQGCSAGVVALEPCRALWMEAASFRECAEQMPTLERALLTLNRQRLRAATRQLYAHATFEVEGRLAAQLLLFADRYGEETPEGLLIPLRLYQQDLADMIASSRTRIWAAYSLLRAEGCFSPARYGRLLIHDRDKLASYCR